VGADLTTRIETSRLISGDCNMSTTTVRIPEDKRDTLKIIASVEKRNIKEILSELIEEYLERHQETLEILSRPDWIDAIQEGLKASEKGEIVKWRKKTSGK
jgi:predicted transcriptional regulator